MIYQLKTKDYFFEDGHEDGLFCCCNFYYEITKRCKKIIIKEKNNIFSSFFKSSSNEVEIYQIFLRLKKMILYYKKVMIYHFQR